MADSETVARLEATLPAIHQVQSICSAPSQTFGVIHAGKVIFKRSTGARNPTLFPQPPDSETIYMLGSVSKMFLSAAVGILVDEGKLSWTDPVSKYIPEFNPRGDARIGAEADIIDCLRHSTGLTAPNMLFLGPKGTILAGEEDVVDILNEMPTVDKTGKQRFNTEWGYNNLVVGLIALVVQRVGGMKFADLVRERILAPLGMTRTAVSREEIEREAKGGNNVAPPTFRTSDGKVLIVPDEAWPCYDHAPLLAATGMRSTLDDMLTFCLAVLDAERAEIDPNYERRIPNNPLKQITRVRRGYWTRPADDPGVSKDAAYGMGWFRTEIPGSMVSAFSGNGFTREKGQRLHLQHILGSSEKHKAKPVQVVAHTGGMRGSLFSVFTFPETQSAVVTMTNGRDLGDASDWTAQLLIQALFDLEPKIDLIEWARKEAELTAAFHAEKVERPWREGRGVDDLTRKLSTYAGEYRGFKYHFKLRIVAQPDSPDVETEGLSIVFNGHAASELPLLFYKTDVYSFNPEGEDNWKSQQLFIKDTEQLFLDFTVDDHGVCTGLRWKWDKDTEPEWFQKVA
ncbi:beta-lactamase/transpeptidase-like protein [Aspergillus karnatakaensis]|uniref:serine hydrolase domain-containing protein n=1 Tax=Aspergillus karnatakaensis TaxID=1810916 RepID=UPI003CCCB567